MILLKQDLLRFYGWNISNQHMLSKFGILLENDSVLKKVADFRMKISTQTHDFY